MDIKFRCPHCFRKIAADNEHGGTKINCPSCDRSMKIPAASFSIGKEIEGFVIEQWLGNGAMGEVYLARQTAMDRLIAIKIMTKEKMTAEDDSKRFVREVQTLAKLNHPNIVSAISAGNFEQGSYLAMTYINGSTIEDKILNDGPMNEKEACRCCEAVADALKYSWDNYKILHRDVKPANFMIDEAGTIHLMDMGIAKSMDNDAQITMAGIVMGTPYYMSPEQAAAEKLDQRSDIYSLGASLYQMMTGVPPYNKGNPMQIMAQKLDHPPEDPQSVNPRISDRMNSVIKKFMAINLDKRVQNWNEALSLLKKSTEKKQASPKKMHVKAANAEVAGRIISSSRKKSSPLLKIIAIILSLAAIIIFFLIKE
jgi:serine/threonine protein kinase